VVQYVNKVGEKFYARKKVLPFVLNPPLKKWWQLQEATPTGWDIMNID